jgi:hypothetical protein
MRKIRDAHEKKYGLVQETERDEESLEMICEVAEEYDGAQKLETEKFKEADNRIDTMQG